MILSILVTTFNRKVALERCLKSITEQTFKDYEVVLIDDCSDDGTFEWFFKSEHWDDARVRYIKNPVNVGANQGDREHIRRFVHELARGRYFVYLCDDDWWISETLLERQMALLETYPTAGIVMGGHLSIFMQEGGLKKFHENVFPKEFMTSDELLEHFSHNPITANVTAGARIYDRENFIRSGVMQENNGVKWEAGFEILLGPACYGDFVYIDQPEVSVEVAPENASFAGTQVTHYMDSVESVKAAFKKPLIDFPARGLGQIQRRTIENISKAYLGNAEHVRLYGCLSYCTKEHLSELVTEEIVQNVLSSL